MSYFMQDPYS